MTLRKFLYLDSGTDGLHQEEVTSADSLQMAQMILTGITGVGLNLSGTLISNVATPVSSTDAATKGYVDANSGSATFKQVEINVGSTPVQEATALFADSSVTTASKILFSISGQAPTGKDADELTMDDLLCVVTPLASQVQVYLRGNEGYIHDNFKIAYMVG